MWGLACRFWFSKGEKKQNLDFDTDEFSMEKHIATAIFILRPYKTQHYAWDMSDDLVIKINSSAA